MRYNTLRFFSLAAAVNLLLVLFPLAAARAADTTVSITTTLAPKAATVQVGDTVSWVNDDSERHRIRSISGPEEFDSGNLDPGESFTFNFAFEGTYSYIDDRDEDDTAYHGTITVSSEPVDPPGGTTLPPPSQGDVEIIDDAYRPATFTIAEGGTVRWVNRDRDHTVTARDRSWDSGIFDVGGTYQRTFPVAGTYAYFCILHPDMLGTIVVTGDGGQPPPTTAPPPTTVPPPPPPPPSGTDVTIIDNAFTPRSISVAVGTTLSWANVGIAPHTVTSSSGGFDSGFLFTGDTYQRTFNAAGAFDYICTIHPEMTGTVTVSGDGGGVPPPPPPTTTVPPPPPPSGSGDVQIVDNAFTPRSYSVAVGSTVRWVNAGALPHTVTSNAGGFDSGFLFSGDTYQRTFNAAGTYDYICTIHPEMTGTVTVTGDGGGVPPPTTPPPTTVPPPPPPSGSGDVQIVDNAFTPRSYSVAVGSTVRWVNAGALPHTVTSNAGGFDSGFVMAGQTYQRTFNAAGTYDYICTLHPEMTGTITVGSGGPPPPTVPPPTTVPPPPPPSGSGDVRIVDNAFTPRSYSVAVGSTVRWVNAGALPHTVTSNAGGFDSGFVMAGQTYQRTFNAAGTYDYICTLHPEMTGTITVGAGGTPPPVTPQDPEGPPGASGTQGAGPADVSILDNAYEPAILEAATGQTITWQNDGVLPHTVTATDSSFDSSFMVPGAVYQLSFGAPGEYAYFCTVHPEMTGVVVVTGEATGDGPVVPVSTTSDDASSPTPLSESETSSSNEVGAVRNVRLEDNFFSPADITVDVGDTVIWRNGGQLPHTATDRGGEFDSGFVEPGKEFEVTFDSVGQYEYFCTIHPEMVGTITVQERRAPVAAGIAPSTTGASSLSIAIALSMSIVVAMGLFTLGMARFARMADAERGTVRPAG